MGATSASIHKTIEGEAEIRALYDEALAGLDLGHENLTVGTRSGTTHVLAVGPEDAPPVVFLPGGNFLTPYLPAVVFTTGGDTPPLRAGYRRPAGQKYSGPALPEGRRPRFLGGGHLRRPRP
jgi:hypothetical protein